MPRKSPRQKIRVHIHAYKEDIEYLQEQCRLSDLSLAHTLAAIIEAKVKDLKAREAQMQAQVHTKRKEEN